MACLHLMAGSLDCAIYVDTGYAYPETQRMVEYAAARVPMFVVKSDRAGQNEREGVPAEIVPVDWTPLGQMLTGAKPVKVQPYTACCFENIVSPLMRRAKELRVTELVCGQRNDEPYKSPSRDGAVVDGIKRLHPIENWTTETVLSYLATKMDVPAHYTMKHSSLDCYDCTAFRRDSADRVEWMRTAHPQFMQAYTARRDALATALHGALNG